MIEDTKDIDLSVDDIENMDPKMVCAIHNKLREDRTKLREQRESLQTELRGTQNKLHQEQARLSHALTREARQQRALAAVAERFIHLGALDALSLEKTDAE